MATKTVVCPECASEVAPGRYACTECGSLLAAVSATPRAPLVEIAAQPEESILADDGDGLAAPPVEPAVGFDPDPEPEAEPEAGAELESEAESDDRVAASAGPPAPEEAGALIAAESPAADPADADSAGPDETDAEVDEDRPLAAFAATAPAPVTESTPPASPTKAATPIGSEPSVLHAPQPARPAWPPADDHGVDPLPVSATPAGAWLPPSAYLDALAVPEPGTATMTLSARGGTGDAPPAARTSPGLGRFAASLDLSDEAPRQAIAAGAALAAIGFLLPWANVLAGAGLLGGYFTQWGLAGPGHWIVVAVLVGLAAIALGGARFAGWPIGLGAIAIATLLVGLTWPYLFGVLGRSVGVWTVLAGAIVLAVGGALDGRGRHDPPDPSVHGPDRGP